MIDNDDGDDYDGDDTVIIMSHFMKVNDLCLCRW